MTKTRSPKTQLFHLLNQANGPNYVLDPTGKIIFCNLALGSWLGVDLNELEQTECVFSTQRLSNPSLDRVRGLSPPLETRQKEFTEGKIFRTAADGHLIWRAACFLRLDGTTDLSGHVLVYAESADLTDQPANPNAERIRDLISQLRSHVTQTPQLDVFAGTSAAAERQIRQIKAAIASDCDVMISGEPGTGREQLANLIHASREQMKETTSQPTELTPIHCSIADSELIQKTFLQMREQGRTGGWILLLDVDELTDQALHELKAFLDLTKSNFRFLSTCSNFENVESQIGNRLSTARVDLTAIRFRKQDIPTLASMMIDEDAWFDEATLELLVDYDWPGNLEEMQRLLSGATPGSGAKGIMDLPEKFHLSLQAQQIGGKEDYSIDLDAYLAEIEAHLIHRALTFAKGNKSQACKLLGMNRAKLGRRIQQLGLAQDEPVVFQESEEDE